MAPGGAPHLLNQAGPMPHTVRSHRPPSAPYRPQSHPTHKRHETKTNLPRNRAATPEPDTNNDTTLSPPTDAKPSHRPPHMLTTLNQPGPAEKTPQHFPNPAGPIPPTVRSHRPPSNTYRPQSHPTHKRHETKTNLPRNRAAIPEPDTNNDTTLSPPTDAKPSHRPPHMLAT